MPIRARLTLWYVALLALVLVVFDVAVYAVLSYRTYAEVDRSVRTLADQIAMSIRAENNPLSVLVSGRVRLPSVDAFSTPDTYWQVVRADGIIAARSANLGDQSLPLNPQALQRTLQGESVLETAQAGNTRVRIYSAPLIVLRNIVGTVQAGASLRGVDATLRRVAGLLAGGTLLAVLIAGVVGFALARAALLASCGDRAAKAPEWKEFSPSGGEFSALMPGTPQESSSDIETDVGAIKLRSFTLDTAGIAYSVQYNDYPISILAAGADVIMEGAVEGMVEGGNYTLMDKSTISLGRFPGRAVKLSMSPGDFLIWNRIYLAGSRMYQVMAVVPRADETKYAPDVARFLDSFKILKYTCFTRLRRVRKPELCIHIEEIPLWKRCANSRLVWAFLNRTNGA